MPKKRSPSLTLRGSAARSFVAATLIATKGVMAEENTAGPLKREIQRQQRGIFK